MLTPKEVKEQGFPIARRKGYDMDAVDEFLDSLTEDYTKLYTQYGKLYTAYNKLSRKAQAQSEAYEALKAKSPEENTQHLFVNASKDAELIRQSAHKDAEEIIAAANCEKTRIIDEASDYAYSNGARLKNEYDQLKAEVQAAQDEKNRLMLEAAAESAHLEKLKGELGDAEDRMDALTRTAGEFIQRFRALQNYAAESADHLSKLLEQRETEKTVEEQPAEAAGEKTEEIFSDEEENEADDGEPEEVPAAAAVEVPEEKLPLDIPELLPDEADDGETDIEPLNLPPLMLPDENH